jgi:hypothetical protein
MPRLHSHKCCTDLDSGDDDYLDPYEEDPPPPPEGTEWGVVSKYNINFLLLSIVCYHFAL